MTTTIKTATLSPNGRFLYVDDRRVGRVRPYSDEIEGVLEVVAVDVVAECDPREVDLDLLSAVVEFYEIDREFVHFDPGF